MEWVMNATIGQLIGGGSGILFLLLLFVEITPIKWNPVSSILSWIGQRTNKELNKEVKQMRSEIEDISARQKDIEEKSGNK